MCSTLALTHAVRWRCHCCTARAWRHGLASSRQLTVVNIVCVISAMSVHKVGRMSTSHTVFVLDLDRLVVKNYMKLL